MFTMNLYETKHLNLFTECESIWSRTDDGIHNAFEVLSFVYFMHTIKL